MMNNNTILKWVFFLCCSLFQNAASHAQSKAAALIIKFQHVAKSQPIHLRDSIYTNAFGEQYQVTKLKYYISNINMVADNTEKPARKNLFFVDADVEDSISLTIPAGKYQKLIFTLGIDSAYNNSGAQDGVLDPLKGMFWTWNSGYVYFKLEGFSPASKADLQRIEHHIGGYIGLNKASRQIEINLPSVLDIRNGEQRNILIQLDLDKYWKGKNEISIGSNALIMVPGALAVKSADNFPGLFSIVELK